MMIDPFYRQSVGELRHMADISRSARRDDWADDYAEAADELERIELVACPVARAEADLHAFLRNKRLELVDPAVYQFELETRIDRLDGARKRAGRDADGANHPNTQP